MTQKTVRKPVRFYPLKYPAHAKILKWLRNQERGSDTKNLIHLMKLGLEVETGETSRTPPAPTPTSAANTDLLPEIRKIVSAVIHSALRDADVRISQEDQTAVDDEAMKKTQDFIRGMANHFG